jgi:hypothetical protein
MSAWKPCRIVLCLGLALALGSAAEAQAQGVVPGGWAPQFGVQSFAGPGVAGFGVSGVYPGYGYGYGYGATFPGLTPYSGTGGLPPYYRPGAAGVAGSFSNPSGQTTSGMVPLIGAIRQSTATRRRGAR